MRWSWAAPSAEHFRLFSRLCRAKCSRAVGVESASRVGGSARSVPSFSRARQIRTPLIVADYIVTHIPHKAILTIIVTNFFFFFFFFLFERAFHICTDIFTADDERYTIFLAIPRSIGADGFWMSIGRISQSADNADISQIYLRRPPNAYFCIIYFFSNHFSRKKEFQES